MASSPRPTLVQALAVFVPGVVLTIISNGRAVDVLLSNDPEPSMTPVYLLGVGALLFAIGFMMTLVVLFRPLFGKRKVDELVEEWQKRGGTGTP